MKKIINRIDVQYKIAIAIILLCAIVYVINLLNTHNNLINP